MGDKREADESEAPRRSDEADEDGGAEEDGADEGVADAEDAARAARPVVQAAAEAGRR